MGNVSSLTGFAYCTFADVPPGVLDGGVAVDVGQQAETEAVAVVGGICEAVHEHAGGGRLERLPDPVVELVVNDGAPVLGFLVGHGLHICTGHTLTGQKNELSTLYMQRHKQTHVLLRLLCADEPGSSDPSRGSAVNPTHCYSSKSSPVARNHNLNKRIGLTGYTCVH